MLISYLPHIKSHVQQGRLLLISAIAGAAGGGLVWIINQVTQDVEFRFWDQIYCGIFILVSLIYIGSKGWAIHQNTKLANRAFTQFRQKIGNSLRQTSLAHLEKFSIPEVYEQLTTGSNYIKRSFRYRINLLQSYCLLAFCFIYLIWLSSGISLMVLISSILGAALYRYGRYAFQSELHQIHEKETEFLASLGHFLDGFKELKLHPQKSHDLFVQELTRHSEELKNLRIRSLNTFSQIELFIDAGFVIFAATEVFVFSAFLPTQTVVQIITVLLMVWGPVRMFNASLSHIAYGDVAWERFQRLIQALGAEEDLPETVEPPNFHPPEFHELELQQVQFHYDVEAENRSFTIGPLDLKIQAGEVIFFVGGNGSGKSTLMKLLTGLYAPDQGKILLNGYPVAMGDHLYLYSSIFTDFHLFDSIYGVNAIAQDQVDALLDQMELLEKTQWENQHFTQMDLSTGQKKRLALIVAMLENKPIVLFDEWAAEQDQYFRKYFYEELLSQFKAAGKTVLAVSHDDRYFHLADRVVKMDLGQIISDVSPALQQTDEPEIRPEKL